MRRKLARTVAAGAAAVAAGLGAATPALAAPVPTVQVPCNVSALSSAIGGASSGAVLRLASSCTYTLTSALPNVSTTLTLQGGTKSTIERSYVGATPDFALLTLVVGGNLTVTNVNFTNGSGGDYGGAIDAEDGPLSVTGGTFSGNTSAEYGGAIYSEDGLSVSNATFTGNSAPDYGGAIDIEGTATISGSTFTGNSSEYAGALEDDSEHHRVQFHLHQQQCQTLKAGPFTTRAAPRR